MQAVRRAAAGLPSAAAAALSTAKAIAAGEDVDPAARAAARWLAAAAHRALGQDAAALVILQELSGAHDAPALALPRVQGALLVDRMALGEAVSEAEILAALERLEPLDVDSAPVAAALCLNADASACPYPLVALAVPRLGRLLACLVVAPAPAGAFGVALMGEVLAAPEAHRLGCDAGLWAVDGLVHMLVRLAVRLTARPTASELNDAVRWLRMVQGGTAGTCVPLAAACLASFVYSLSGSAAAEELAFDLSSETAAVQFQRSVARFDAGAFEEASAGLELCLAAGHRSSEALAAQGCCLVKQGAPRLGVSMLVKSLAWRPELPAAADALMNLVYAYEQIGDQQAVADLLDTIEDGPAVGPAMQQLLWMQARSKIKKHAFSHARTILERVLTACREDATAVPGLADLIVDYARACLGSGRTTEGFAWLERVAACCPERAIELEEARVVWGVDGSAEAGTAAASSSASGDDARRCIVRGIASWRAGDTEAAVGWMRRARVKSQGTRNEVIAAYNATVMLFQAGEAATACAIWIRTRGLSEGASTAAPGAAEWQALDRYVLQAWSKHRKQIEREMELAAASMYVDLFDDE